MVNKTPEQQIWDIMHWGFEVLGHNYYDFQMKSPGKEPWYNGWKLP